MNPPERITLQKPTGSLGKTKKLMGREPSDRTMKTPASLRRAGLSSKSVT